MTSFGAARLAWPLLILLAACAPTAFSPAPRDSAARAPAASADDFRVVDCLLPGQVRQLGQYATYVSRRRPVQTTARDCQVRGGEYVAHDPASYAAALQVWLPLANQDDREAQTIVGELYEKGLGRAPDYRMAAQWYRKAAEAGEARAQINLAHLYEKGLGVERDPAASLRWYRQAAGVDLVLDPQTLNTDRQERNALKDELARSRRELGGARSDLARLRARLEDAERKVQRLEQPAAPDASKGGTASDAEREQELERLRSEIRQLKARALEAQKQAAERPAAQAPPPVAVAGPSIQILDPPLTATTRGVQLVNVVNVAQDLPNRAVVGQVTAPAGVLSVIVDGREAPLDGRGIFKTTIPIRGASTEVSVVAIDKLGARASVAFLLESRGQVVTPAAPAPAPAPEPALSRELFEPEKDFSFALIPIPQH